MKRLVSLILCLLLCLMIAPVRQADAVGQINPYIIGDQLMWNAIDGTDRYLVTYYSVDLSTLFSARIDGTTTSCFLRPLMAACPSGNFEIGISAYDSDNYVIAKTVSDIVYTFTNPYDRVTAATFTIIAPAIGAEPSNKASIWLDHGKYTSFSVEWYDANTDKKPSVFEEDTPYYADITVNLDENTFLAYETDGTYAAEVNGITCVINSIDTYHKFHVVCAFPKLPRGVYQADIRINEPFAGEYPSYDANLVSSPHCYIDSFTGDTIKNDTIWVDTETGDSMKPGVDVFLPEHTYEVRVWLTADSGYAFSESMTGKINNHEAELLSYKEQKGFSYTFTPLPPAGEEYISFAAIGLNGPFDGDYPDYTADFPISAHYYSADFSGSIFKNDIFWKDVTDSKTLKTTADYFKPGHVYSVGVYLTPKTGYRFTDSIQGTINGYTAEATNRADLNQAFFTYEFPEVPAASDGWILTADVKIPAPRSNYVANYIPQLPSDAPYYIDSSLDTGPIKNDMCWFDMTDSKYLEPNVSVFEVGHVYQVSITLTPISGHRFSASLYGTINGHFPEQINIIERKVELVYTFPAVPPDITSIGITIAEPAAGKKPSYSPTFTADSHCTSPNLSHDEWENGVSWTDLTESKLIIPNSGTVFKAGHSYKVTIYAEPEEGYLISTDVKGTVNGKKADAFKHSEVHDAKISYTFNVPPLPTITKQPQSVTVTDGATASFTITAKDAASYQWQGYMDEMWSDLTDSAFQGAKTATLKFKAPYGWNGLRFRCVVSNSSGSATSAEVTLTVKPKQTAFEGSIRFNEGEVSYKGTTPYVVWNYDKHEPAFTVIDKNGNKIDPSKYSYTYKENQQAGTGYVIVTMKNGYSGTLQQFFKIYLPATTETTVENVQDGIKISWAEVKDAAGYVIYRRAWNLKGAGWTTFERWNNTTDLTWTDTTVYAGTRYQYGIKAYFAKRTDPVSGAEIGGNVGDNYNLGMVGPLKTTVRITTRKLTSVKAGTKKMTVKWDGSKVFTGYELQYATNSSFTKGLKKIKITNPATVSKVIKKLKTGKKYYIRIRSYHEFEGMTYYGQWSAKKSCKVK